jgi:hypothetical protein
MTAISTTSLKPHDPKFSMLRAAFWLLAAVVGVQLVVTFGVGAGCFWLVMSGAYRIGACENISSQIREVWAEAMAAILALLLAAGAGPKPPTPPTGDEP